MTTPTSTIKIEEAYPSLHGQAKVLNNKAAHVIATTSNYEEGSNLFAKALKLTEQSQLLNGSEENLVPCSCKYCSLESCLVLSEERKYQHQSSLCSSLLSSRTDIVFDDDEYNNQESHATKKKSDNIDQDNDGGFVYRRLLLIDDHSIKENHYMGTTLSLVITFNLALTHHLMGIDNDNTEESLPSPPTPTDFSKNFNSLQNAVTLYQLAHQLHINYTEQQSFHRHNNTMEDDDDDDHDGNASIAVTLRLTMIVSNNIGQLHRVAGNSKKYAMCLQHLLSSIMYMGQQLVPSTVFNSIEFDGLIRNVSPIVFHGSICATAA